MSSPVAPSASSSGVSSGSTSTPASKPAGLKAELAKTEVQLADWVYCPSSKTPEGKHKIEQITQHIDQIKARISGAEKASEPVAAVHNRYSPLGVFVDETA